MPFPLLAAGLLGGSSLFGAISGIGAAKKAKKAAAQAREDQLKGIADQQGALQELLDSQQNPVDVFNEIFTSFPGLLDQVLPAFRRQSIDSAKEFTTANVDIYDETLKKMFPHYADLRARREGIINEMDPQNLGQEEIKGVTRKLSTLIPEGTLDPNRGSVAGGTTSPVSLYRNLVSGLYQQRREQFLGAATQLQQEDQNSATRQQVRSEAFLPVFLNAATSAATGLTAAVGDQEQQNIALQGGFLNTLLSQSQGYDPSAYDAAAGSAVTTGLQGLASAFALSGLGTKTTNTFKGSPIGTTGLPMIHSMADRPAASYYTGANPI